MQKDLFFYSKFCNHSTDVITMITKMNIRDFFIFVCVDDKKYNIPKCVTHVPTIITKNKELVTDTEVMNYLGKFRSGREPTNEDIAPFCSAQTGYSSSYIFLTDNGYDVEGLQQDDKDKYININANTNIYTPVETDNSSTKTNKFDDSMYEKYLNSRNTDDDFIKKKMR